MVDPSLRERIRDLATADRLELMHELWQSLETSALPVTDAERDLIDERLTDLEARPLAQRPWSEIEHELRRR